MWVKFFDFLHFDTKTDTLILAVDSSPMDGFVPLDYETESPLSDDSSLLSSLLNLDGYTDLSSPSARGQVCSPFDYAAAHQVFDNWSQSQTDNTISTDITNSNENSITRKANPQFGSPPNQLCSIPKPLFTISLPERMLQTLSLLRESANSGFLAQFWLPVKQGNNYVLTTTDQPFLLDQSLAGYREISRQFAFAAKDTPDLFPGLPGRVFISGLPEWTPNVLYYNKFEYLRVDYAASYHVRGSLAVPVFDTSVVPISGTSVVPISGTSDEGPCCAILEIVTMREKPNFDSEMDIVCNALQSVNLQTVKAHPQFQGLTRNQKLVCTEMRDVLKAVCQAHALPLALTWVPHPAPQNSRIKNRTLSLYEPACYAGDPKALNFIQACAATRLEEGRGIAGRALRSGCLIFSGDVRDHDVRDYPLAHHARTVGCLRGAVAVMLRSTHTGANDYVVEIFLPLECSSEAEQEVLVNALAGTMHSVCRSLRAVVNGEVPAAGSCATSSPGLSVVDSSSQGFGGSGEFVLGLDFDRQGDVHLESKSSVRIHMEKKRSTMEKQISLSVLKQYFAGSLKDAAKSIGVCPTTLKRICRQHGITRWPSRKISKVNRSLKKIQTVINSVHGVEGSLKYDPFTGRLVPAVSSPDRSVPNPKIKTEPDYFPICTKQTETDSTSMTDSSGGGPPESKSICRVGSVFTVKAIYRNDTVRFKLWPSSGYEYVIDEVAKRFKLEIGKFQLKYRDDEEEWVILASDSDLKECIEIAEGLRLNSVKFLVRDLGF